MVCVWWTLVRRSAQSFLISHWWCGCIEKSLILFPSFCLPRWCVGWSPSDLDQDRVHHQSIAPRIDHQNPIRFLCLNAVRPVGQRSVRPHNVDKHRMFVHCVQPIHVFVCPRLCAGWSLVRRHAQSFLITSGVFSLITQPIPFSVPGCVPGGAERRGPAADVRGGRALQREEELDHAAQR